MWVSPGPTGKAAEPFPPGCRVPKVPGGRERDPACVEIFVDDAISVEVQWKENGARFKALTVSLVGAHFGREKNRNPWRRGRI